MPRPVSSSSLSFDLAGFASRLVRVASPTVLVAVAACGGTATSNNGTQLGGNGGSNNGDASPGAGGITASGGHVGTGGSAPVFPNLTMVDGGYPSCTGTGMPGLYGPCCKSVHCIEPPDAGVECPAGSAITPQNLGFPFLGSGQCECGGPIEGPYSTSSAQQYSATHGPCCYVIGVMGCTGRPLVVEGKARLAPLVRGGGWV